MGFFFNKGTTHFALNKTYQEVKSKSRTGQKNTTTTYPLVGL